MQILHASPLSVPQFTSLSFLIKPSSSGPGSNDLSTSSIGMGEPMILASPFATTSSHNSLAALKELHSHLTLIQKASSSSVNINKIPASERLAAELFREDNSSMQQQLDSNLNTFRPLSANGISLHYRLLRGDEKLLQSLSSHIFASTKGPKASAGNSNAVPAGLVGVVFCVGVSGVPSHASSRSSGLQYSLPQRMNDCLVLLSNIPDPSSAKVVLSTFLLADDELRKTQEMVQAPNVVVFPDSDDAEKGKGLLSPMGMITPMAGMISPMAEGFGKGAKRRSKHMMGGGGGDLNGDADNPAMAGMVGVTLSLRQNSAVAALEMTEKLTVLSVAESDTFLRKYARMGQERKANLDLTGGGKSRFSRRRKGEVRDADLDNFDYKGPSKMIKNKEAIQATNDARQVAKSKSQLLQPKKDTKAKKSRAGADRKNSMTNSTGEDTFDQHHQYQQQHRRAPSGGRRRSNAGGHYDHDDVSLISDGRSAAQSSVGSHSRMQVNIALNEDLSCSYKLSQLSSCSVEGVVQVSFLLSLIFRSRCDWQDL